MALREVKKKLTGMEKIEIIQLITVMYKKIPSVKTYLDIFATGEVNQIAEKYKKDIERYVYPSGANMVLRESEAIKLIRTVQKMGIIQLNVELELHYVNCCLEVIRDFGYWDDNYYVVVQNMFDNAVNGISELGILDKYEEQLSTISHLASTCDLDLYY